METLKSCLSGRLFPGPQWLLLPKERFVWVCVCVKVCVCIGVLSTYLSVYHVFAWCPRRPEEEADPLKLELQTGAATGC